MLDRVAALVGEVRKDFPNHDHWARTYFVSAVLIKKFLGPEWTEEHILSFNAPTDFFKNDGATQQRQDMFTLRVIHLAEMLLNLQYVPGFAHVLKLLKDGDIEGTYAELEVVKLLRWSSIPVRFNVPQNVRGLDYDLGLKLGDHHVCAEAKCKVEATDPSEKTILSTLRKSANQVPADKPGMFFVKLPQTWNEDGASDEWIAMLERVSQEFFSKTQRVVSVFFYFSLSLNFAGTSAPVCLCKQFVNPNHRFDKDQDWTLMKGDFVMTTPPSWVDLVRLCA